LGYEVYNPTIDYNDPYVYFEIKKEIKKFNPDWIIGSSMGGYLGYYYAQTLDIKALLFNPAFKLMDDNPYKGMDIKVPKSNNYYFPLIQVHLGDRDNVVDNRETQKLIKENLPKHSYDILIHDFGHRIPLKNFKLISEKNLNI
jgi:predicted acylesterase/phospholipase RssA